MDTKKIRSKLENRDGSNYLVFLFDNDELIIDLNSDNQESLNNLFYKMMHELFNGLFEIEKPTEEYVPKLFADIANDYIDKLNKELKQIWEKLPPELKKTEDVGH